MTEIGKDATVRDVVVNHPAALAVFESFGIDYCCGGNRPLADAAADADADLSSVLEALAGAVAAGGAAEQTGAPERSWTNASLTELADHIEDTHHVFMKTALPRLGDLFTKVLQAHGEKHGDMLRPLHATFSGLRAEIEAHLMKEEQILFPYIREMEAAMAETGKVPPMHCGTVQNPIRQMGVEHDAAGEALAQMRSLTDDYCLPEDACATFAALFDGLQELEADLHRHIHLENNILFLCAVALEARG